MKFKSLEGKRLEDNVLIALLKTPQVPEQTDSDKQL